MSWLNASAHNSVTWKIFLHDLFEQACAGCFEEKVAQIEGCVMVTKRTMVRDTGEWCGTQITKY